MKKLDTARILIVDDQIHALQGVSRIMRGAGYETFEASNGADCLKMAAEHKPDLILLDVVLPDIDGREVCRLIKSNPETADIYVVLLSSIQVQSDSQAEALERGADGYIARPIPNRELLARVKAGLRLKYAENRLRESEERYRRISSLASDIAYSCIRSNNTAYSIDWIMGAVERITGHSEEDIKALGCWRTLVIDEDRAIFDNKVMGITPGSSGSCELRLRNKSGRIVWVASSAECVLVSGTPDGLRLYGGLVDITERKMAEETLRISEDKFGKAFYLSPDAITITRLVDGMIVSVNEGFKKTLGYTAEELIANSSLGIDMWDNPEDRNRWTEKLKTDGKVDNFEACFRSKDGDFRYGLVSAVIITINREEHILTIGRDITERKRTEEALRLSEVQKTAILNGITTNIALVNNKLEIQWVNKTAAESVGRSPEEMIGSTCHSLWADPERPCENCPTLRAFQTKKSEETMMTTPDGRVWNERGEPVIDDRGNLIGVVELAQDITEYRRLSEQEKWLVTAIEQSAEAVIITKPSGIIQYVNPAQEIRSGYSSDELIGQTPNVLNSDFHEANFHEQIWDTIGVGKTWQGRFVNKKKDGTEYHEDASISPVYDKSGNLTNFVAVKHDVTKQVTLQEQLLQAQKMEALGTLAGGFAHDFNNKLQVIDGYVDLMLFDKDLPETFKQNMIIIKQAVDSSAELIKGMMVFSRKTPIELQTIDLNKLVAQTRSMLARSISKMIEIDLLLADDLWAIKAAPNQIDQILMNLAVNARDAMPEGGKLTIETNNIVLDEEYCSFDPLVKPGRYVLIEVSDTGTGMNKETASHIFEPFFTTKEEGKGTGLGLAVIYGIVEQHGARIVCDSAPSVGTTFRIYFPAIEEVHEEEYFENREPPRGESETLLLVDDEPHLRDIVARQLVGANYRVIKASNGNEALKLYEQHRKQISLVILDLLMPGMGGKQCLEALRKLDPNVRVLIASGALNSEIEADLKKIGARGLIAKPFDTPQLLEKISKIIYEN